MWVLGWPFITEHAAKQARELGFASPDTKDTDAGVYMLSRILGLEGSHPAEYVVVKMGEEWAPVIALYRDDKAKNMEDARIPRDAVPSRRTCLTIQRLLGIPRREAPQWYWTDGEDV